MSRRLFLLFVFSFCFAQLFAEGELSPNLNESQTTNINCSNGTINAPLCNECQVNFERKGNACVPLINQQEKPTNNSSSGRRWFLLFIGGLFTVMVIVGMIFAYGQLIERDRNRRRANPTSVSNESNEELGGNVRRTLQRINWNPFGKRIRLNFFSISNNNSTASASHLRQNENPDEALLFDDPYADAGLHGSSANPYKSLTLAVT